MDFDWYLYWWEPHALVVGRVFKDFIVLEPIINESDLVISHCGAVVLLECLRSKKNEAGASGLSNIAVINSALMNNHQSELGDKLHGEGYNVCTDTAHVLDEIQKLLGDAKGLGKFNRFPPVKNGQIIDLIDEMLLD